MKYVISNDNDYFKDGPLEVKNYKNATKAALEHNTSRRKRRITIFTNICRHIHHIYSKIYNKRAAKGNCRSPKKVDTKTRRPKIRNRGRVEMNRKKGRKLLKPPKAEFEMLYYNNSVEVEQLAKHYGVSKQTIYNWAVEFRKEGSHEPRNRTTLRGDTTDSPEPKQIQHEPQPKAHI